MKDSDCVLFLKWALPKMKMRWRGFKKVRRQVCKKIDRRIKELNLATVQEYKTYLLSNQNEWQRLYLLCTVTITRFYRDIAIFNCIRDEVLPILAERAQGFVRCWSAGCASGEEPYTLAIIWKMALEPRFPSVGAKILATDITPALLHRARIACYKHAVLRNLPKDWIRQAFIKKNKELYCLKDEFKKLVYFKLHDVKRPLPEAPFHLVLCRNLAFTYFDRELQLRIMKKIARELAPAGVLVIGSHEDLPEGWDAYFSLWPGQRKIFTKKKRPA